MLSQVGATHIFLLFFNSPFRSNPTFFVILSLARSALIFLSAPLSRPVYNISPIVCTLAYVCHDAARHSQQQQQQQRHKQQQQPISRTSYVFVAPSPLLLCYCITHGTPGSVHVAGTVQYNSSRAVSSLLCDSHRRCFKCMCVCALL